VSYQKTSGWISQDHLCGIPWTTCNWIPHTTR
jgi:hypothetical protein